MNIVLSLLLAVSFLEYFEKKNQAANFILTPPQSGENVKIEKPNMIVEDKCSVCDGIGQLKLEEPNFGQSKGRIGGSKKSKKSCPICHGSGRIKAYMNPSDLAMQVARDRDTFANNHQGKGDIPVGDAYVPGAVYADADKDRVKLVKEAYGTACKSCNWTGLQACRTCHGNGIVKCSNSDCKGGWSVTKTTTEKTRTKSGSSFGNNNSSSGFRSNNGSRRISTKETKITVLECPTCKGAQYVICPECGGRRAHPCKKCNGLGLKQKGSAQ